LGGFLGIGKSAEAKALEAQRRQAQMEAEKARREAEIRLAEKRARKGQETANIKLGTAKKEDEVEDLPKIKSNTNQISSSLGFANKKKTGVQI